MMKSNINTVGTYEAPVTFTVLIEQEHNFVATTTGSTLSNMNQNSVYDESF